MVPHPESQTDINNLFLSSVISKSLRQNVPLLFVIHLLLPVLLLYKTVAQLPQNMPAKMCQPAVFQNKLLTVLPLLPSCHPWSVFKKSFPASALPTLRRILPKFSPCSPLYHALWVHLLNSGKILHIMPFRVQTVKHIIPFGYICQKACFRHVLVYCIVDICQNSAEQGFSGKAPERGDAVASLSEGNAVRWKPGQGGLAEYQ